MKKIGQGLQFNAYEENGKVIKIPKTKFQMKLKLLKWNPLLIFNQKKLEKETIKEIKRRRKSVKEIKERNIPKSFFAELNFVDDFTEQEKVNPLKKLLNESEKSKEIIDKYIEFIFKCWQNGFSEETFNFTINNGVNQKGEMTLLDFGELTFSKKHVLKQINHKRWEKAWSFNHHLKKELKEYYKKQMNEKLSKESLDKYWKSSKPKKLPPQ